MPSVPCGRHQLQQGDDCIFYHDTAVLTLNRLLVAVYSSPIRLQDIRSCPDNTSRLLCGMEDQNLELLWSGWEAEKDGAMQEDTGGRNRQLGAPPSRYHRPMLIPPARTVSRAPSLRSFSSRRQKIEAELSISTMYRQRWVELAEQMVKKRFRRLARREGAG